MLYFEGEKREKNNMNEYVKSQQPVRDNIIIA